MWRMLMVKIKRLNMLKQMRKTIQARGKKISNLITIPSQMDQKLSPSISLSHKLK